MDLQCGSKAAAESSVALAEGSKPRSPTEDSALPLAECPQPSASVEEHVVKEPPQVWKRRLPRDAPFWLLNVISDPEARDGKEPVPSEVLALSSGGDGRACLYSQADDALAILAGEAEVELIDDAAWINYPEFGAALSRLFTKEECLCVALCRSLDVCAVGVSMSTRMRRLSAKVALAVTLALRSASTASLHSCPFIVRLIPEARQARQEPDGCPTRSAYASPHARSISAGTQQKYLRISSPCAGSTIHWAEHAGDIELRKNLVEDLDVWVGHCVCCKRPLTLSLEDHSAKRSKNGEACYAYVCAIWGTDPQFVLGAMVLGWSLRRYGTKHDLVAMHTDDVAPAAVALLSQAGWRVRQIPYMRACNAFFWPNTRFRDVFTKLHAFGLVEYDKILMLDSDLLVCQNLDHLFDMQAPAAMARGIANNYTHGQRIDGRCFFGGHVSIVEADYSWGQQSGINAGVMLLEPCLETLDQFLQEVGDPKHPEHIRGTGPEQDYLSRYFAGNWTHMSVAYNYQLHQMYFQLSPFYCVEGGDRTDFLRNPNAIKVFHYSSHPKPWSRHMDSKYATISDQDWLREVQSQFRGYHSWVLKDPEYLCCERGFESMGINASGELHHAHYICGEDGKQTKVLGEPLVVPAWAINGAEEVLKLALHLWDDAYHELAADLKLQDLAAEVVAAVACETALAWDACFPTTTVTSDISKPAGDDEEGAAAGWQVVDSWSSDLGEGSAKTCRAAMLASMLPEACAAISLDGNQLLSAKGKGVHVAVLEAAEVAHVGLSPCVRSFAGDESAEVVSDWAKAVPVGSWVLMAIVDPAGVTAVLKELTNSLGPQGLSSLPRGCTVAVAAGKKGGAYWADTRTSAEVASLVLHIP